MVLQSSAEIPLENTRAGLYEWMEDIGAIGLHFISPGVVIKKFDILSGEESQLTLTGDTVSYSSSTAAYHTIVWADDEGEYIILKVGSAFYLVSLVSGACSLLLSGSDCFYRGTVRVGDIITAMIFRSSSVSFVRRNVAGDREGAPGIVKLSTVSETGSSNDMILGACGGDRLITLKYNASDSRLKTYDSATVFRGLYGRKLVLLRLPAEVCVGNGAVYRIRRYRRGGVRRGGVKGA